jgi:hypothetical protein
MKNKKYYDKGHITLHRYGTGAFSDTPSILLQYIQDSTDLASLGT